MWPVIDLQYLSLADPGDPLFVQDLPTFIFPPPMSPKLRATVLEDSATTMHAVPADPSAIVTDNTRVDVNLATADPVTVHLEAEAIQVDTCVDVRIASASGATSVFKSTPLVDAGDGTLTATADVTFPAGFSVVQLRAFFGDGNTNCPAELHGLRDPRTLNGERVIKFATNDAMIGPPAPSDAPASDVFPPTDARPQHVDGSHARGNSLRDLKTLNGERIIRVEVGSTMGSDSSKLVYITETGRRIPVGW